MPCIEIVILLRSYNLFISSISDDAERSTLYVRIFLRNISLGASDTPTAIFWRFPAIHGDE